MGKGHKPKPVVLKEITASECLLGVNLLSKGERILVYGEKEVGVYCSKTGKKILDCPDIKLPAGGHWAGGETSRKNNCCAVSPDERVAYFVYKDFSIIAVDIAETGKVICKSSNLASYEPDCLSIHPSGAFLAVGCKNHVLLVEARSGAFEIIKKQPMKNDEGRRYFGVLHVHWNAAGTILVAGFRAVGARLYDDKLEPLHDLGLPATVLASAFSPDGTRLAVCTGGYKVFSFDAATGKQIAKLSNDVHEDGDYSSVCFFSNDIVFSRRGLVLATKKQLLAGAPYACGDVFDCMRDPDCDKGGHLMVACEPCNGPTLELVRVPCYPNEVHPEDHLPNEDASSGAAGAAAPAAAAASASGDVKK